MQVYNTMTARLTRSCLVVVSGFYSLKYNTVELTVLIIYIYFFFKKKKKKNRAGAIHYFVKYSMHGQRQPG